MTDINRAAQLERMREAQRLRLAERARQLNAQAAKNALAAWGRIKDQHTGARIDSENKRASVRTEVATTRELERSRITLHDAAQSNPILHKVLIAMQKAGAL